MTTATRQLTPTQTARGEGKGYRRSKPKAQVSSEACRQHVTAVVAAETVRVQVCRLSTAEWFKLRSEVLGRLWRRRQGWWPRAAKRNRGPTVQRACGGAEGFGPDIERLAAIRSGRRGNNAHRVLQLGPVAAKYRARRGQCRRQLAGRSRARIGAQLSRPIDGVLIGGGYVLPGGKGSQRREVLVVDEGESETKIVGSASFLIREGAAGEKHGTSVPRQGRSGMAARVTGDGRGRSGLQEEEDVGKGLGIEQVGDKR